MDQGLFATVHWRWRPLVHASCASPVTFGNSSVWIRNGGVTGMREPFTVTDRLPENSTKILWECIGAGRAWRAQAAPVRRRGQIGSAVGPRKAGRHTRRDPVKWVPTAGPAKALPRWDALNGMRSEAPT